MVERGIGPKSLMEGLKGGQELDHSSTMWVLCVMPSKVGPPVGGSTSPFIDEGDDFTSERATVRMLPGLAIHVYQALLSIPAGVREW